MSGLSFRDAMELVPDDLPDGAYWAMCHEMAGLDYGDGFDQIGPGRSQPKPKRRKNARALAREAPRSADKPHRCGSCGKDFATKGAKRRHRIDAHKKAVVQ